MDAETATALLDEAVEARASMRRGDERAVARLEDQYSDMRDAMTWLLDEGRLDLADRFASALVPFWMTTKRIDDGDAWFGRALGDTLPTDPSRGRAVYDHGYLVFWAGRYELADQRFSEARELAERGRDWNVVALALAGAARVALNEDPRKAVGLLRKAMEVTADLPDSDGRSSADHVLGVALQMAGDLEGARDVMLARLERARASGNEFVVFTETANLGMVERQLGNLDNAEALSLAALRYAVSKHDDMAIPWTINGLAAVTAAQGRFERAATLMGIAESLLAKAGGDWPADEREQFEGTLATLSAGLSPDALANARASGAGMAPEAATSFAMAE